MAIQNHRITNHHGRDHTRLIASSGLPTVLETAVDDFVLFIN
jgi:hypothetical protein